MTRPSLASKMKIPAAVILVGYWLCMFVGTHLPNPQQFIPPDLWDKALHATAYAGLTALALLNLRLRGPLRWSLLPLVVPIAATVGLFDEVTQIPVGRDFEWLDLAADLVGAITATILVAGGLAALERWPRRRLREA
jgi:VanZ family protein